MISLWDYNVEFSVGTYPVLWGGSSEPPQPPSLRACWRHTYLQDMITHRSVRSHPIYNGAKPEYTRSVFLGAFSVLRSETDEIPDAALRPTSIQFGCDAKTATHYAPAEGIAEMPLR